MSEVKTREESLVHYVCTETESDQRLPKCVWLPLSALCNNNLQVFLTVTMTWHVTSLSQDNRLGEWTLVKCKSTLFN